jgi:hypothetical protein
MQQNAMALIFPISVLRTAIGPMGIAVHALLKSMASVPWPLVAVALQRLGWR